MATAQCYWVLGEYLLAEETRDRHGIVTLQIEPSEPEPCQEARTFITALLFAKKKAAKKKAEAAVEAVKGEDGVSEIKNQNLTSIRRFNAQGTDSSRCKAKNQAPPATIRAELLLQKSVG